MKSYFAYIRVSTTKQGEEGVSLQEQRRAILEYATRKGFVISEWFEEQVSAAKRGRPVFSRLVTLIKARKAAGIIIHKIDRGTRNLRDWADMGELIDKGVDVHFAHESIDLHSRSGRLSADILAVIAADYIRNLREEVRKGIYGRLKQGMFPFRSPMGYKDNGAGKPKLIDPVIGPHIKAAFELYAEGKHTLNQIANLLFEQGVKTSTGRKLSMTLVARILRNPFYIGLIQIRNRKETFAGAHAPLVTSSVFNQVQFVIDGKRTHIRHKNRFLFSCLIKCETCRLCFGAERQKGHVYYRCHRIPCGTKCIREEKFEAAVIDELKKLHIPADEACIVEELMAEFRANQADHSQKLQRLSEHQLDSVRQSTSALLQKYLDGAISKEVFDDGYGPLLMERTACEERLGKIAGKPPIYEQTHGFVSDLRSICETFCTGSFEKRRALLEKTFSEISATRGAIQVRLTPLMTQFANRERTRAGWERLLPIIAQELATSGAAVTSAPLS